MSEEITRNIYEDHDGKCLFPDQFDLWIHPDWGEEMPKYFQRLNAIKDDRSFVILAISVLEYRIDKFIELILPNPKKLLDSRTSISKKLDIIGAFNYIPKHFLDITDLLRLIRNDFAHDLSIDSFDDANKHPKLLNRLDLLDKFWKKFESDMVEWSEEKPIRIKFKDLWQVCIEGFNIYEINVKLFRQETENKKFIDDLMKLAILLKSQREKADHEQVIKILSNEYSKE